MLQSAFIKLIKALILLKQKKLLKKCNIQLPYSILPPLQAMNHIYDWHSIKLSLDNLLRNYPNRWYQALSNEFGRLNKSNDAGVRYTNTMNSINHSQIPSNKN